MKNKELLTFKIDLYSEYYNHIPEFKIYFNDEVCFNEKVHFNRHSFQLCFRKNVNFGKNFIDIEFTNDTKHPRTFIKVENIKINEFGCNQFFYCDAVKLIDKKIENDRKNILDKKNSKFKYVFEAPYAYYFLRKLDIDKMIF